jgi:protease I
MNYNLEGKKVAILATDGFEQSELEEPRASLEEAGAKIYVVSPTPTVIKAWDTDHFGNTVSVDVRLQSADVDDYDALLLPGGVMNPDSLRQEPKAVKFVRGFFKVRKPVAAICHGPIMLIEAGVVKGRRMTSFPSIKTDLANAGARWSNKKVIVDGNLVTSRKPADIPSFNECMLKTFGSGRKQRG